MGLNKYFNFDCGNANTIIPPPFFVQHCRDFSPSGLFGLWFCPDCRRLFLSRDFLDPFSPPESEQKIRPLLYFGPPPDINRFRIKLKALAIDSVEGRGSGSAFLACSRLPLATFNQVTRTYPERKSLQEIPPPRSPRLMRPTSFMLDPQIPPVFFFDGEGPHSLANLVLRLVAGLV